MTQGETPPLWQIAAGASLHTAPFYENVEDLQAKVFAFIDYYNQTMAKPFKWTYQGKALTV